MFTAGTQEQPHLLEYELKFMYLRVECGKICILFLTDRGCLKRLLYSLSLVNFCLTSLGSILLVWSVIFRMPHHTLAPSMIVFLGCSDKQPGFFWHASRTPCRATLQENSFLLCTLGVYLVALGKKCLQVVYFSGRSLNKNRPVVIISRRTRYPTVTMCWWMTERLSSYASFTAFTLSPCCHKRTISIFCADQYIDDFFCAGWCR